MVTAQKVYNEILNMTVEERVKLFASWYNLVDWTNSFINRKYFDSGCKPEPARSLPIHFLTGLGKKKKEVLTQSRTCLPAGREIAKITRFIFHKILTFM